ncbi:transcriptional regulator, TetR family [Streptomyces sp. DvalAA-14]|uniref:TetR family transcriptional regulator n=1 Tax=unclassified Streptomyces TaxID=2593676 RepID=UPI00081B73F2|nr:MULTISPECIES: TetR family transcriptional regulator [unclassified Streptomyces]MYS21841.1 TetR family transcriptional regulator [Streptomyces sp. SID4948]SCE02168.1 transcriptional regulator, TetR family [Streptomyces sp. DvalAA-14]
MHRRARSQEAKLRRAEDLLDAARVLAAERGGVRHVTLAAVTESAGLHPSAVRRYFDSKEELLLELAERGWNEWRDILTAHLAGIGAGELDPARTAAAVAATLAAQPLFCDLLTHVPLSLEGDVGIERARRYKTTSFSAYDAIVGALTAAGTMTAAQVQDLVTAALGLTANLWQLSHPTPSLAELYATNPRWGHAALDFEPRLTRLLQAMAAGLTAAAPTR